MPAVKTVGYAQQSGYPPGSAPIREPLQERMLSGRRHAARVKEYGGGNRRQSGGIHPRRPLA
jgi:hypothetical protein